jgi:hypothetical protein
MKSRRLVSLSLLLFLFLLAVPGMLFAQNEIERERISLEGLQEFGFTANIEGSRTIADSERQPSGRGGRAQRPPQRNPEAAVAAAKCRRSAIQRPR